MNRPQTRHCHLGRFPQTVPCSGLNQQRHIRSSRILIPVSVRTIRTKRPRPVANNRRLIVGLASVLLRFSGEAPVRRETRSLRPPIFQKPFPIWYKFCANQAIQDTIRAWMAMEKSQLSERFSGEFLRGAPDSRSGFILGSEARTAR